MIMTHLKYFIEVVDTKSFTQAAENLYISQSTISKAVKSMEKELGTKLIERSSHEFVITEHGRFVYEFAMDLFKYYEIKERELHNLIQRDRKIVKFGLPPSAGSIYFHSLISKFKFSYPEINLQIEEMTSNNIVNKLRDGSLDLGVIIEPSNIEGLNSFKVLESEAVLVVSFEHKLSKKNSVNLSSLWKEKFIQMSEDFMYYNMFMSYCDDAGFQPNIVFKSKQFDMVLEMVIQNQGVTILPKPLVDKFLNGRAKVLTIENPKFLWSLSLAYGEKTKVTKSMEKFIELSKK